MASQASQAPAPPPQTPAAAATPTASTRALDQYCVTCHSQRLKTGGLSLEGLDAARAGSNPELWEKVVRKLQARSMPPQGVRRPDEATYHAVQAALEAALDAEAAAHPNPGAPILHRLNRAEYANAVRDLLDLDVDVTSLLPPDDSAYGFDNISDVLGVSPSLQEKYVSAAMKIAAVAVGNPDLPAGSDTFRIRQDLSQDQHIDGLPLGTIGGTAVRYTFPLDADYVFQAKLYRTNLDIVRGLEYPHDVEVAIDGKRVYLATIGGREDLEALFEKPTDTGDAVDARLRVRVPVTAGPHDVTVAFVEDSPVAEPVRLQPFLRSSIDNFDWAGRPHIQTFTITGPFNASGPGDTPSRRRIFACRPKSAAARRPPAPSRILSTLVRRAYRAPVEPLDMQRVMKIYREGRRGGTFETGIEAALQRILAAPKFTFRVERDQPNAAPGTPVPNLRCRARVPAVVLPLEQHSRRRAAEGGRGGKAEGSRRARGAGAAHAGRSSAHARSWTISRGSGCSCATSETCSRTPTCSPISTTTSGWRSRPRRSSSSRASCKENRSVADLMTADYTFVNERLAKHYGIPDIHGSRFRRVTLTDERRFGLLGKGSVLAVTSHAERTSPVVRGKWVLDNILGAPVPPPPPDIPQLKEKVEGEKPKTMREQMAEHRTNPVCATCHKVMDPIGLSMENFDVVGAWRNDDEGNPIDATGQLGDGTKVDGVVTLRKALMAHPEVFVSAITEKLTIYALGRGLDARDMPAVRAIIHGAADGGYRFSSIVLGIVRSTPFTMRVAQQPASVN